MSPSSTSRRIHAQIISRRQGEDWVLDLDPWLTAGSRASCGSLMEVTPRWILKFGTSVSGQIRKRVIDWPWKLQHPRDLGDYLSFSLTVLVGRQKSGSARRKHASGWPQRNKNYCLCPHIGFGLRKWYSSRLEWNGLLKGSHSVLLILADCDGFYAPSTQAKHVRGPTTAWEFWGGELFAWVDHGEDSGARVKTLFKKCPPFTSTNIILLIPQAWS